MILKNISLKEFSSSTASAVDRYWTQHTVLEDALINLQESIDRIHSRNHIDHPFCADYMGYYQGHDDQIVLDYGCGPGDDLIGFLGTNKLKKIIGMDVSSKAIDQLMNRLELHQSILDIPKVELIKTSNTTPVIPLEDNSIDYINCAGVLHHTDEPQSILHEFFRVLKPGHQARIMVYNYNSVWVHLFLAYIVMILHDGQFGSINLKKMNIREAFEKTCDGIHCPIAKAWTTDEFTSMCSTSGFACEFIGGYLGEKDYCLWDKDPSQKHPWTYFIKEAIKHTHLHKDHKDFLSSLTEDSKGFPLYKGKHAGVHGVYLLTKPAR